MKRIPSYNYISLISQGFHADVKEGTMCLCWHTEQPFLFTFHVAAGRSQQHQREALREQILVATWIKAIEK